MDHELKFKKFTSDCDFNDLMNIVSMFRQAHGDFMAGEFLYQRDKYIVLKKYRLENEN